MVNKVVDTAVVIFNIFVVDVSQHTADHAATHIHAPVYSLDWYVYICLLEFHLLFRPKFHVHVHLSDLNIIADYFGATF